MPWWRWLVLATHQVSCFFLFIFRCANYLQVHYVSRNDDDDATTSTKTGTINATVTMSGAWDGKRRQWCTTSTTTTTMVGFFYLFFPFYYSTNDYFQLDYNETVPECRQRDGKQDGQEHWQTRSRCRDSDAQAVDSSSSYILCFTFTSM